MSGKLQLELHRNRPFDSVQQEVFLSLVRTADHLVRGFDELFKPYKLSVTQYNVLRILRAADEDGLPCKKIGERMITRDPDITRLLDRLEGRNLITRQRDTRDRRVVAVRITSDGLQLLTELEKPVNEYHLRQLAHVDVAKLTALIDILEVVREANVMPATAGESIPVAAAATPVAAAASIASTQL
jgi:DNA-binding MarR family transcriptional regulator